jgi:hypothetical protein
VKLAQVANNPISWGFRRLRENERKQQGPAVSFVRLRGRFRLGLGPFEPPAQATGELSYQL